LRRGSARLRRAPALTRAARGGGGVGVRRTTARREPTMPACLEVLVPTLRVYALARQLVRAVNQLLPRIAERSRELADQVDRSSRSVPANIAEGEHRHDGHGRQRFKTAYGSARETRAHLESAAVDIGALREELVEALADPDAYAREWMLATP